MSGGNLIKGSNRGPGGTGGDYFFEAARGKIPNTQSLIIGGCNPSVGTSEETIWPLGGIYSYLTTPTELFITSSNAGDTGQIIFVTGLRAFDGKLETAQVFTNGQNPVSTGNWYRVLAIRNFGNGVAGGSLLGTLYLALAGTWTAGVPNNLTHAKGVIPFDAQVGRSLNVFNFPGFTTPVNQTALITNIDFAAPKGKDVRFSTLLRPNQSSVIVPFQDAAPFNIYQSVKDFKFHGLFVDEMWDLEIRAVGDVGTAPITVVIQFLLFDQT